MIDRKVESLVREIFNAVVVADEARFQKALQSVPQDLFQYVVKLATAVDHTVMNDLHDGQLSDERLDYLTNGYSEMEGWYRSNQLPVKEFLKTLAGLPAAPIGDDVFGLMSFLVGGWLLASFLNPGTHWYEYYDDILERLDQDPESVEV